VLATGHALATPQPCDTISPGGFASAARCYAQLGLAERAVEKMETAVATARLKGDKSALISALEELGTYSLAAGDVGGARAHWDEALRLLDQAAATVDTTGLLLRLGAVAGTTGDLQSAAGYFGRAWAEAKRENDIPATATAMLGLARVNLQDGNARDAVAWLDAAAPVVRSVPDSPESASLFLNLGELYFLASKRAGGEPRADASLRALNSALESARRHADAWTESFALGYLGAIAEWAEQYERALRYSRLAVLKAQEADALDGLYRWQWQTGRVLAKTGNTEDAIIAYRQSVNTLTEIRPALLIRGDSGVHSAAGSVYLEFTDLLLKSSGRRTAVSDAQSDLRLVRETVEQLKVSEVQDYFAEDCVVAQDQQIVLESVGGSVAVVYPIIFDDRVEVLVSIGDRIDRHTAAVSRGSLAATVRDFRKGLQDPTRNLYREPGQRLYQWLVEPALTALRQAGTKSLVFVPDGPLRSVPPAAFYDGEHFLIEEFAVSATLGLSLASPRAEEGQQTLVFASGLSEAVQGFPALENVGAELDRIGQIFAGSVTQLRDEEFLQDPVARQMKEGSYTIVHMATHGEFKSDYRQSYLLTYDDKLTMDTLEQTLGARRYLNRPLDLLVLSACETAVGDDRAALGLAGVALKAGARSAVATLWKISDRAAPTLVSDFYAGLQAADQSKAAALREAQLDMLGSGEFHHPYNWAAFLLVGNWL